MVKPRPCAVCNETFTPHPRAGTRQGVCGRAECQRERHRRNCLDWHKRNAGYDHDRRLRARLAPETRSAGETQPSPSNATKSPKDTVQRTPRVWTDPLAHIQWESLRDVVAPEVLVVLEELATQLVQWARDAVTEEVATLRESLRQTRHSAVRDAFAGSAKPP